MPADASDRLKITVAASFLVVASLFYLLAPPPRPARAEAGVYSVFTGQVSVTSSSTMVVAARPGRFDVNIEETTSGANLFCGSPAAGHGAVTLTNGHLLPAGLGSNMTLHTAAEVDCISVGATVVVSYAEDF